GPLDPGGASQAPRASDPSRSPGAVRGAAARPAAAAASGGGAADAAVQSGGGARLAARERAGDLPAPDGDSGGRTPSRHDEDPSGSVGPDARDERAEAARPEGLRENDGDAPPRAR